MDQNKPAGDAPADTTLAAGPAAAEQRPAGPGAQLRAARERQGVHIAALAASIKVTPRKLEALEADRWQELPDATFTRALAQAVCRALKIDPKPVLEALPAGGPAKLDSLGNHINTPLRDRSPRQDPAWGAPSMRPWWWGAGLLLLGAVGVMFAPSGWWPRDAQFRGAAPAASAPGVPPAAAAPPQAVPTPEAAASAASAAAAAVAALAPGDGASAAGATAVPVPVPVPGSVPASGAGLPGEPMATAQVLAASPAAVAAAPAAPATFDGAPGLLQLYAARDAWVGVRDAQGQQIVSRKLAAGERFSLDASPPLKLTVGNADGVELRFRGQIVNLTPHVRANVARLDLE